MSTTDAERVKRPKLPKKRLIKSKGKSAKHNIKFCPKCGSTNIFWASGLPQLWSVWECRNCGYRGALILEDSKLAEKLEEKYKEKTIKP